VLSVRIDGVIRRRFVVSPETPVVLGRAPEGGQGIMLGQWLTDEARKWISRGHVMFALRPDGSLTVQDVSTNGSGVRPGGSTDDDQRITLGRNETRVLAQTDVVELYAGVNVGRSKMWATGGVVQPTSVMAEAPTMALRPYKP
jgi:hypothetical protein